MFKLIIVDDEIVIRKGLSNVIDWDEYGIEIVGLASNGKEALEMVVDKKPDIIISDIRMPEMDGLDLLKDIKELDMNIKSIVLSGYNDFEYVKTGIKYGIENYLLKPIDKEELEQTIDTVVQKIENEIKSSVEIKKNKIVIKNNIFNRLLLGKINYTELIEKAEAIGFDSVEVLENIYLACVSVNGKEPPNLVNRILDVIEKKFYKNYDDIICFKNYTDKTILIFINIPQYQSILHAVLEETKTSTKSDVLITVSNKVDDLMNLNNAYNQALQIQLYSIIKKNAILYYSEVNKNKYLEINSNHVRRLYKDTNSELLYNYFVEILDLIIENDMKPDLIYNMVFDIVTNGFGIIKDLNGSIEKVYSYPENIMYCIISLKSIEEIKSWTKDILLNIQNYIYSLSTKYYSGTVNKMIAYVNENFEKEISLKTISELFNYNPIYMGRIFKNETGELFSDFLNRIRIENSVMLLHNKKLSTLEIAQKVGFASSNYYYKVFKKYKGVTPTEYRNNIE